MSQSCSCSCDWNPRSWKPPFCCLYLHHRLSCLFNHFQSVNQLIVFVLMPFRPGLVAVFAKIKVFTLFAVISFIFDWAYFADITLIVVKDIFLWISLEILWLHPLIANNWKWYRWHRRHKILWFIVGNLYRMIHFNIDHRLFYLLAFLLCKQVSNVFSLK